MLMGMVVSMIVAVVMIMAIGMGVVIFAVSVLGLTLVPGQDVDGRSSRMGFFDAFYFMSYTATTISTVPMTLSPSSRLMPMRPASRVALA